jgi:DNA-binding NarL/FixJ family response regulator
VSIRILIVDDHAYLRKTLRVLLARQPDMQVVGEAASGKEAIRCCQELMPDVATIDVHMPVMNGVATTQRIRSQFPSIQALGVSSDMQPVFIERMLAAGASGYVLKDFLYEELPLAVRAIARGRAFLGRLVVDELLPAANNVEPPFVEGELAVLRRLVQGKDKKQIGQDLALTPELLERTLRSARNKAADSTIGELVNRIRIE